MWQFTELHPTVGRTYVITRHVLKATVIEGAQRNTGCAIPKPHSILELVESTLST